MSAKQVIVRAVVERFGRPIQAEGRHVTKNGPYSNILRSIRALVPTGCQFGQVVFCYGQQA
jgi:hypothetical protein